jgi:NAD(P) transhydrogenase subunit alpha
MKLIVPKEVAPGEQRVGLVPESVKKLRKAGYEVLVEQDAGLRAGVRDVDYADAGAEIAADARSLYEQGDIVFKVQAPCDHPDAGVHEAELLKEGTTLVATLQPLREKESVKKLAERKITSLSMDFLPRITRAQSMDVLSSQSTVGGYKAVLLAAAASGKFFPMLTTAAGTIRPAKAFIIGAGVAGLQAIATARRLGAVVEAFDVRPAVKEQVMSLGAKFVEVDAPSEDAETAGGYAKEVSEEFKKRQAAMTHEHCKANDVVITTALIFGKGAPELITEDMVKDMAPGSVIVDLAAEAGGNCALTEPGKTVVKHDVTIIGELNLPATMPVHASQMYSRNLTTFLLEFSEEGKFNLNREDEIIQGTLITHEGEIVHEMVKGAIAG